MSVCRNVCMSVCQYVCMSVCLHELFEFDYYSFHLIQISIQAHNLFRSYLSQLDEGYLIVGHAQWKLPSDYWFKMFHRHCVFGLLRRWATKSWPSIWLMSLTCRSMMSSSSCQFHDGWCWPYDRGGAIAALAHRDHPRCRGRSRSRHRWWSSSVISETKTWTSRIECQGRVHHVKDVQVV